MTHTIQLAIKHGAPLPVLHRRTLVDEVAKLVRQTGYAAIEADGGTLEVLVPGLLLANALDVVLELQLRADLVASFYWTAEPHDGDPPTPEQVGTRGTVLVCRTATVLL